jgi:hypothetical protein
MLGMAEMPRAADGVNFDRLPRLSPNYAATRMSILIALKDQTVCVDLCS